MKIHLENVGPLRQAEFEVGDLTMICGENNTGKTYATYALYGFLNYWKETFQLNVNNRAIEEILTEGTAHLDLNEYVQNIAKDLGRAGKGYKNALSRVFASKEKYFEESRFSVQLVEKRGANPDMRLETEIRFGSSEKNRLHLQQSSEHELQVSLFTGEKGREALPPAALIKRFISDAIKQIVYAGLLPNVFISSAERTGTAIFQKELDFNKNKIIELLKEEGAKFGPFELLGKFTSDYAFPVRDNVNFIRELENLSNRESFISKQHPEVLDAFSEIVGGEYKVIKNVGVCFVPDANRRVQLTLNESSSSVRSMLDLGFYLRHIAQPGDLLMVDEPELNLHPKNQRLIARLFARLVHLGIKVFVTSHSDYIVKELNTLIMLNHDNPYIRTIREQEGYQEAELIAADQIKVYIAETDLVLLTGYERRTSIQTLVAADIDPRLGIEAHSFDSTIDDMNRIQESLYFAPEDEA